MRRYVRDENLNLIDYELAVEFMDEDICQDLHNKLAPCTDQEFFDAYRQAHAEKFEEDFVLP